ncbi:lambda repressor (triple mutanT)/DNA compleX-DNA compleX [Caudoviricetes sp.]|nr:lambda repressor (triple mutanT)/DNA compleX-DNA compleX [Caudoviricetes sp.]UOF81014.1 lambda repressor (triple mutanT)/DNA compleX-DNA compleX [Caudoviricetes sp.]UOF81410.1 lambda repressor (triple mutanT)/DNA compleX-DNA compleX [Caudoviricetes sp.]
MIKAKDSIKTFITSQLSIVELAERLKVSAPTLYSISNNGNVSSELVAKLLKETGFEFEKAFEIEEEQ